MQDFRWLKLQWTAGGGEDRWVGMWLAFNLLSRSLFCSTACYFLVTGFVEDQSTTVEGLGSRKGVRTGGSNVAIARFSFSLRWLLKTRSRGSFWASFGQDFRTH